LCARHALGIWSERLWPREVASNRIAEGKGARREAESTRIIGRFFEVGIMRQGVPGWRAWRRALTGKGWWRMAGSPQATEAMTIQWFKDHKLATLTERDLTLQH
jgi:hypothetical protein